MSENQKKAKTIVLFSDDLDKAMAAFNIALGAASIGSEVNIFCTFWGTNILRKENAKPKGKNFIETMFGIMMPKGANKVVLSKMNMFGMGTWIMKKVMKKKQIAMLPELLQLCRDMGVQIVACSMTMDMMGFTKDDLIDGIEFAGVAGYIEYAERSDVNLFI